MCKKVICLIVGLLLMASCNRDDQKEVERIYAMADSLPATALQQLKQMDTTKLVSESSRALYALAVSDLKLSLDEIPDEKQIKTAVDYYKNCWSAINQSRYALARLCQGQRYAFLGDVKDAATVFHQVQDDIDDEDAINWGLSYLCLAELYACNNVRWGDAYKLYHQSLKAFEKAGNLRYRAFALMGLGGSCQYSNRQLADSCVRESQTIALKLGMTPLYYADREIQAAFCVTDGRYAEARDIALDCLRNGSQYVTNSTYNALSMAYSGMGNVDSAALWLNHVDRNNPRDTYDDIFDTYAKSCVAFARLRYKEALHYSYLGARKADSLLETPVVRQITDAESDTQDRLLYGSREYRRGWWHPLAIVVVFVIAVFVYLLLRKRHKRETRELQAMFQFHKTQSNKEIKKLMEREEGLSAKIRDHVAAMNLLVVKSLSMSPREFYEFFNREVNSENTTTGSYWKELNEYITAYYGPVADKLIQMGDNLTERESQILKLLLLDFSTADIAVVLHYSSPGSVRMTLGRLSRKLGMPDLTTMRDYVTCLKDEFNISGKVE